MDQEYDPCVHGLDSACVECAIEQLLTQAQADEEEIVLLQTLLARVVRCGAGEVPEAAAYLQARGLL